MNQGSYYLYEYEHSTRRRNVGFLQLSPHCHSCILTLHIRNLPISSGEQLEVHAFLLKEHTLAGFPVALLNCSGQNLSTQLTIQQERFPHQSTLEHIDGFLLFSKTQKNSLQWIASSVPLPDEFTFSDLSSPAEPPAEETDSGIPDQSPSETATPCIKKISHKELSLLPRRFWSLANNSFLLHGYHNYNHLLLVEEEGHLWLGVPGIYDPREAYVANLFGFPQFTASYVPLLELSANECESSESFGHWCRCLR